MRKWLPVIIFAFSKKEVEAYSMTCKDDLTNYEEKVTLTISKNSTGANRTAIHQRHDFSV
jgi:superfamily II RNA helicase